MPSCSSLQLRKLKIPYVMIFRAMLGNVLPGAGNALHVDAASHS